MANDVEVLAAEPKTKLSPGLDVSDNVEVMAAQEGGQLTAPVDLPPQPTGTFPTPNEKDLTTVLDSNLFLTTANEFRQSQDINKLKDVQSYLSEKGYNLGNTGVNQDGVDGDFGKKTKAAMKKELDKITSLVNEKPQLFKRESPIEMLEPISKQGKEEVITDKYYTELGKDIAKQEGYSESLPMNVPSTNSGITIAGVDLKAVTNPEEVKDILAEYIPKDKLEKLWQGRNLTGEAAKKYLEDNDISISLTEEQLSKIPAKVAPIYEAKLEKGLGKSNFDKLPASVKVPLVSLTWLNYGEKSVASLKKAIESENPKDIKKAINMYENYWNKSTEHNQRRSQAVADALKKYYKL